MIIRVNWLYPHPCIPTWSTYSRVKVVGTIPFMWLRRWKNTHLLSPDCIKHWATIFIATFSQPGGDREGSSNTWVQAICRARSNTGRPEHAVSESRKPERGSEDSTVMSFVMWTGVLIALLLCLPGPRRRVSLGERAGKTHAGTLIGDPSCLLVCSPRRNVKLPAWQFPGSSQHVGSFPA